MTDETVQPEPAAQGFELRRWRKAERERLIAARLAVPAGERERHALAIARDLDKIVPLRPDTLVGLYWPFRGEPDLRPWMRAACERGIRVALPVVIALGKPLVFREWTPGARLERGVWNIPFPADGDVVVPNVVVAPLVGFDPACYRLGYGGGFFDRTLAAMTTERLVVGVGHPVGAIETIHPQPHDIPMDWIVTGIDAPKKAPTGTS